MGAPVVFTGLSISHGEARTLLAADIRSPIKRGDLDRVSGGTVVAIIDGELDEASAVPLNEIRRALRRGVRIVGAASVGALRAYETQAEGMAGLGWVYKAYCAHRITGTDEIAVLYEPASHSRLTVPLVNIRFCLEHLSNQHVITATEAAGAMASLKGLELPKRGRQNIMRRLARVLGRHRAETLIRQISPAGVDVKRRDAHELLRSLAAAETGPPPPGASLQIRC